MTPNFGLSTRGVLQQSDHKLIGQVGDKINGRYPCM